MKNLTLALSLFVSLATNAQQLEEYHCHISGQVEDGGYPHELDQRVYDISVGDPKETKVMSIDGENIGTLKLQVFGNKLTLIFRPTGTGNYISGSAPLSSNDIGFSTSMNGLENSFTAANCTFKE